MDVAFYSLLCSLDRLQVRFLHINHHRYFAVFQLPDRRDFPPTATIQRRIVPASVTAVFCVRSARNWHLIRTPCALSTIRSNGYCWRWRRIIHCPRTTPLSGESPLFGQCLRTFRRCDRIVWSCTPTAHDALRRKLDGTVGTSVSGFPSRSSQVCDQGGRSSVQPGSP